MYPEYAMMNRDLEGKTSLEVLDKVIEFCGTIGLKVILDNHSREPDGYMTEELWYTPKVSHAKWIQDWVFLAERYKGNKTVVGFDIDNEPHGKYGTGARWGNGDPATDWRLAAEECGNRILEKNPDVLIIVEGTETVGTSLYWWGGNLTGVRNDPVRLSNPEKLVYSPHEYGPEVWQQPWFSDPSFPANLEPIWDRNFGYIAKENRGHLLVGEFGIGKRDAFNGVAEVWFDSFLAYMGDKISWTFWAMNPNSGDTGGILEHDWKTVEKWKVDKLRPYMAPSISIAYTTFAEWAAAGFSPAELGNPAISGPAADPDGVGVANLLRYALGLPARGRLAAPPTALGWVTEAGQTYAALSFNRKGNAPGLSYVVEASDDLITWTVVGTVAAGYPNAQSIRDAVPTTGATRRFLRLRVQISP